MTDDERAIRDLVTTWMRASEAGDTNTVLGLMADDALFMVPGREPFGKDVFRTASQAMKNVRLTGTRYSRDQGAWRLGVYPQLHRACDRAGRRRHDVAKRLHALDISQTVGREMGVVAGCQFGDLMASVADLACRY